MVFLLFSLQWVMATILLVAGPFIFKVPTFNCSGSECTEDNGGCERGFPIDSSANSITTTFKLYCDQKHIRTFAESGIYIGSIVGLITYSFFSISRKAYLFSSWMIMCVALLIMPFSVNAPMFIFFWMMVGFGINPAIMIHITILDEQCGN